MRTYEKKSLSPTRRSLTGKELFSSIMELVFICVVYSVFVGGTLFVAIEASDKIDSIKETKQFTTGVKVKS